MDRTCFGIVAMPMHITSHHLWWSSNRRYLNLSSKIQMCQHLTQLKWKLVKFYPLTDTLTEHKPITGKLLNFQLRLLNGYFSPLNELIFIREFLHFNLGQIYSFFVSTKFIRMLSLGFGQILRTFWKLNSPRFLIFLEMKYWGS